MRTLLLGLSALLCLAPAPIAQDTTPELPPIEVGGERDAPTPLDRDPEDPGLLRGEPDEHAGVPTREEFFDGLVAPLALAPDILLTPVLGAVSDPESVLAASAAMEGHALDVKPPPMPTGHLAALAHVPEVLHLMALNAEWMELMRQAMATKRAEVMTAIQRVRRGALEVGNLGTDEVMTVTDADGRITIKLTDPAVLRVPRYDGSLVYLDPLVEGPPLISYGPAISFPGYQTAEAGLRSADAVVSMRTAPPVPLPMASTGRGTVYRHANARRGFITGLLISRNNRRNRDDPARRLVNAMGAGYYFR